MLPNSVTVGEKSSSSAIVAALMNFIVIIGVRKTAIASFVGDGEQIGIEMRTARNDDAGNFLRAKRAETAPPNLGRQTLEVRLLGRAENLHAFLGEISVEAGEREAGTIDRGLANLAMKADTLAFQLELQVSPHARCKNFRPLRPEHFSAGRCRK